MRVMFTGLPNPVSASASTGTVTRVADRRDVFHEFAESHEADVGNAKRHIRDAGAGDVDALEAEILDHAREQRIRRARENNRALCGEECLELRRQALRFGWTMHCYDCCFGWSEAIKRLPQPNCQQFSVSGSASIGCGLLPQSAARSPPGPGSSHREAFLVQHGKSADPRIADVMAHGAFGGVRIA